jgi:hypothetical protein
LVPSIGSVITAICGTIPLVGDKCPLAHGGWKPRASWFARLAGCGLAALLGGFASVHVRGTTSNTDVVALACGQIPIVIGLCSLLGRHISILTGVVALAGRRVPVCVSFAALAGRLLAVPRGFVPLASRRPVSVSEGSTQFRASSHYHSRSSRGHAGTDGSGR